MLHLIMSLLVGIVTADDSNFELAAVALLSNSDPTSNEATCIKTSGDIEYWVNIASEAAQATRIVATSGIEMPQLIVNGPVTLGSDNEITINGNLLVSGTIAFENFAPDMPFYKFDSDGCQIKDVSTTMNLKEKIKGLEQRIASLEKIDGVECD